MWRAVKWVRLTEGSGVYWWRSDGGVCYGLSVELFCVKKKRVKMQKFSCEIVRRQQFLRKCNCIFPSLWTIYLQYLISTLTVWLNKRPGWKRNRFAVTWQYFGCLSYQYECSGPSVWTAGCSVGRNQTERPTTTIEKIIWKECKWFCLEGLFSFKLQRKVKLHF